MNFDFAERDEVVFFTTDNPPLKPQVERNLLRTACILVEFFKFTTKLLAKLNLLEVKSPPLRRGFGYGYFGFGNLRSNLSFVNFG